MFSMFDRRLWRIIVLTFVSIASRKPLVWCCLLELWVNFIRLFYSHCLYKSFLG
jgi:hypothetical protein